jgi:hypothetical protein
LKKEKNKYSFWKIFFIALGVIFVLILIIVVSFVIYFLIKKPYGIDLLKLPAVIKQEQGVTTTGESVYDHPLLDTEQEIFLENLGVDLETVPTEITQEQENCAVEALGAERVEELKSGGTPSISDYIKGKHCL